MSLFANQSREALRTAWREAWQRGRQGLPLEPLQAQMVALIELHPEYQPQLADPVVAAEGTDASANPFLHLALHLALREQLGTERPAGIRNVYQQLVRRSRSAHEAEHRMIDVLAEALWQAQRDGRPPDEQQYLASLRACP